MGKAVVTTTRALQGIQAVAEEHVLIEDTVDGFSNAVSMLIKDQKARKQLGQRAREFVMKNHHWPINMKKLDALLQP